MEKLPRNSTALIFQSARDKAIKLLSYSILMTKLAKRTNFLLRNNCITSFSCCFLCLQITAETSKIKKCTRRSFSSTFNVLLKYFNILVSKLFLNNI